MKDEDYISKLLTGKRLDAPGLSEKKGKELKEDLEFGYGYVKY